MANILSVTPYQYTPPENGGHHGIILVDKLLNIHNRVTSLSTQNNSTSKYSLEVELSYTLPNSLIRYIPFYLEKHISRKIQETKATHLLIHHHYLFPSAYKAAKKSGIPLYIRSHNIETERFKSLGKIWWPIMGIFEKWAYRKADKTFFVTEDDRQHAIQKMLISPEKCITMPFGIDVPQNVEFSDIIKEKVAKDLNLNPQKPWIFFMGKLDYPPNAAAVDHIIQNIYPKLKEKTEEFQLIIFGKGLSQDVQQTIEKLSPQVKYLGFVPDIEELLSSCQIMLNPVNFGGGVKTKVVESIAWNNTIISSKSGAIGIEKKMCGDQLIIVEDEDWNAYVDNTIDVLKQHQLRHTPKDFYNYYSLDQIANRLQKYFL